jgi:ADP-ribose pyrophosphatase
MGMNNNKWKLTSKKPVFETKWLTVEERSYLLPDGRVAEGYYHLTRPDYVIILAVDDEDRIVVEKQYRRGVDDFVYELPAGWINPDETPVEAAIRELKEETGLVGEGNNMVEIYPQPGFCSMKANVVMLKIKNKGETNQDDDEDIMFEMKKVEDVKKMISEGKIKDMGMLAALTIWENGH